MATVQQALNEWKTLGVRGWLEARQPWFYLAEELGAKCSKLVGAEPEEVVPDVLYEEETICGDFLRQLSRWQTQPDLPLPLPSYLPEQHRSGGLAAAAEVADAAERERVLREAAALGIDLLSGEEPRS